VHNHKGDEYLAELSTKLHKDCKSGIKILTKCVEILLIKANYSVAGGKATHKGATLVKLNFENVNQHVA